MSDKLTLKEVTKENEKLRKTNRALINQVEKLMDNRGGLFSIFQTNLAIERKVEEKTKQILNDQEDLQDTNEGLQVMNEFLEMQVGNSKK